MFDRRRRTRKGFGKMTKKKSRLPTETEIHLVLTTILDSNDLSSLPLKTDINHPKSKLEFPKSECLGNGERLEVRREKSGRGGKTVTTVCGFPKHISNGDLKRILKEFKSRLGTGGGWRNEQIEIQGDRRREVVEWLSTLGFKPVLAGG